MQSKQQNSKLLPVLIALWLVVLLVFGIHGTNLVITHALVEGTLEKSVADALDKYNASSLSSVSKNTQQNQVAQFNGLRLSRQAPSDETDRATEQAPKPVLSSKQNELIATIFAPNTILASTHVPFDALPKGQTPAEAIAIAKDKAASKFLEHGPTERSLNAAFDGLVANKSPFVSQDIFPTGEVKPYIFVSIPEFGVDGKLIGGFVVLTDQSELLSKVGNIPLSGIILIGAMCGISILFAGGIIWMRFRDQVKVNRDIQFLAHHDTLTGLPNRAVYNAKLNEGLRLSQAKASNMAAMLIDVDKFKEINDTYGHGTGDIFLQIIADRLRHTFKDHLVARLSGDEFAVMVTSYSDVARLTKLAAAMIAATKAPCVIDGKEIQISLSIGIARASDGSWRASRLLHCADLALYAAKHSGRSTFVWYSPEMDADAQRRKEIEADLVKALKFDQFQLVFQPQYSLIDNQLKGYESLIRWEHPTKGLISPDIFIPIAEDTGLIQYIGDWVLNHACNEAAAWEDKSIKIAVNVSAAQFLAGETDQKVRKALETSGLEPERLEVEITESLLISNPKAVVETLQKIHAMGVSIAMDDFGTGYSSLSYLSRFPFDKIKIDRSFIQNLGEEPSLDAVVTAIIGLGHSLDVQITAEGVETEEQVILLRSAGCHLVQGFLFGRPGTVASHEARRDHFQRSPITGNGMLKRYQDAVELPHDPLPETALDKAFELADVEEPSEEKEHG
ncbi:bifunctional diguanylate cyclase/phosphodiesterase [Roseibium sp. TrichSKD4]|uniref:putative bifunctional diguanylate cyclase/phosphodiesterase n=1 Tax=Roseibium sp. TrichSKD4 TaxID=744980 RepID=UPI000A2EDD87|nr:bifunctional diguanylate cyclase/phosphodiesterase [Roseibium sp. TrichSKD4]